MFLLIKPILYFILFEFMLSWRSSPYKLSKLVFFVNFTFFLKLLKTEMTGFREDTNETSFGFLIGVSVSSSESMLPFR